MTASLHAPLVVALSVAVAATVHAAEPPDVLFVGGPENHAAMGLRALSIPHQQVTDRDMASGSVCLFDFRVLICGMDVGHAWTNGMQDGLRAFVEAGGTVLCLRSSDVDSWLPAAVRKDRAYTPGAILVPDHPIFTTPHRLDAAALSKVHGGSIYNGFFGVGDGWVPLIAAGPQQAWDKEKAQDTGPHYGIIEMKFGRGTILLCQMLPEYAWFNDDKGAADSVGAKFFENLVRYVQTAAVERKGPRKPRAKPEPYVANLWGILTLPDGTSGLRLDAPEWTFTARGPYTGKPDRRGVYTISHGDAPAQEGGFGQLARRVPVPAGAKCVMLRVYQSDDYCGGIEPKMVGDRRVSTSENRKGGVRFRQVLIDDTLVTETDVLGPNIQPASDRIQWYDVTDAVKGKAEVTLALRVTDRTGTGEDKFPTDCFFACVDLRTDLVRLDARGLSAEGYTAGEKGMALAAPGSEGSLSLAAPVRRGVYRIAVRVLDHPYGQGTAEILVGGKPVLSVTASADDLRSWWVVTPPVTLDEGTPVVWRAKGDGEEKMVVSEIAFSPAELCAEPVPAAHADDPIRNSPVFKSGPLAEHEHVALTVAEPAGVERYGEVASQGIQFAFGALRDPARVAVFAPGGTALPVQVCPFAFWPDRSIMSAVVSFPVEVAVTATAAYELNFGTGVQSAAVEDPLTVDETDAEFTVNTGPQYHLKVPRRSCDPAWSLELETEDGRRFASDGETVKSCDVIERGPLRAVVVKSGQLRGDSGNLLDYRFELQFARGSSGTRFFVRFSNTTEPGGVFIKRLSLRIAWPTEHATTWILSPEGGTPLELKATGAVDLYQHLEDTLSVAGDGVAESARRSRAPGRMTGWVTLAGQTPLHIGLRYAAEMYPKRLRVDGSGVTFDLVPPPLADADIPEVARQPESPDRPIGGVGYPQGNGHPGVFRLAVGESISHELWFCTGEPETASPGLFQTAFNPLRAWADPAYVAATRALCEFHPVDRQALPGYEEAVERAYQVFMKRRQDRRQFGMENFGDDTFEWGYGPAYTFWSNQEDDRTHGMLMQYARSGDRRWWEIGEQAARHYRDVDGVLSSPKFPGDIGGPIHHNNQHFVSKGWVSDHREARPSTGHSWIEGLIDYWLLTGDLLAGDACVRMGDWYARKVEGFEFGAGGQERGQGWALTGLTSIYRATWDRRYLDAAQRVQDWVNGWQDPIRGCISVPISEQPSYEGGTTFMHGIVAHGVARLYAVTGEPRTLRSLRSIAEWIVSEPMGPFGRVWYKQAPSCKHGYSYDGKAMTAMSHAYRFTGDPYMGAVTEEIYDHIGADIRSMPFLTPTLAHVAAWRKPVRVALPGRMVTVSLATPTELRIPLTNLESKPLDIRIEILPTSSDLTVDPQSANLTLEPGKTTEVSVRVGAKNAEVKGGLTLAVTAAGTEKRVPLAVRVLPQVVRIETTAKDGNLTSPMKLVEDYAVTERGPDFPGTPRPADGVAGGAISWKLAVPCTGRYVLQAEVYWLDDKGNSFYQQVDTGPAVEFGNDARLSTWQWVRGRPADLTAGEHTVKVQCREDGARVRRIVLTNDIGEE